MTTLDPYGRIVERPTRLMAFVPPLIAWGMLLGFYLVYVPELVTSLKFPNATDVMAAQQQLGWGLIEHAMSTLLRVIAGFSIGCALGVALAFLMYAFRHLDSILFSFIEAIRPIPPIALVPFFILWFQLHVAGQICLIALGCMMVLVVSTREALQRVSVDIRRAAHSLGARGISFYREILFPAILPQLVGPLRVALALAFALAVAAEFMGAQQGIGFLMMVARRTLNTETILLGVVILGLQSAGLDYLLRVVLRFLTRWHG